ncbi:hypothetical protein, partial [Nostoc sp.]|uniref:hypothetical protein n=1 Tax=Nostoc sp. TaxID=1180 RepID=UPI002FFC7AC6
MNCNYQVAYLNQELIVSIPNRDFDELQWFNIAIASIVRTKVVEHALLRLVNNQRYPDICG